MEEKIRSPVMEGWYYPEDASEAAVQLYSFGLERGKGGTAQAILAPHGAWTVSGAVAARSFASAAGREKPWPAPRFLSRVVLLGALHGDTGDGLFLSESDSFETPLGNLPVDTESSEALASSGPLFEFNDIPHLREHSLEVLLPLVKYCFPAARIVPILMGSSRPALISCLGRALEAVFRGELEETLFVISCNLSKNADDEAALSQARKYVRLLEEKDGPALLEGIQNGDISACGAPLAASLLESGLLGGAAVRLESDRLVKAGDEAGAVYYGALSFG